MIKHYYLHAYTYLHSSLAELVSSLIQRMLQCDDFLLQFTLMFLHAHVQLSNLANQRAGISSDENLIHQFSTEKNVG